MDDYLDLRCFYEYRDVLMFKITKDTNILFYTREEYKAISEQACAWLDSQKIREHYQSD